jgi:hypothetical protein
MNRGFLWLSCLVLAGATSCGPMRTPMAPRVDDETQKRIDDAWENMLSPVDRLDHQQLLDVFVGTAAYQHGVDRLSFRSEKRFSRGLVVMEVSFERADSSKDRFEVTVYDNAGRQVRKETYGRKEVEQTYHELFVNVPRPREDDRPELPEFAEWRAAHEARWAKIGNLFPRPEEHNK